MAVRRIVTVDEGEPVLRGAAVPIRRVDADIRQLMDDMIETMREAPGVGLAAPQIGVARRVIVVETPVDGCEAENGTRLRALANPRIVWADEETEEGQEACLSVPDLFGDVPRAVAIRVTALDRDGRTNTFEASGFEARVLQHEIDHLDGVLFPDRVPRLDMLYHLREDERGEYVRVPYAVPVLR